MNRKSESSNDGSWWFPKRYGPALVLISRNVVSMMKALEPDYTDATEVKIRCEVNGNREGTQRDGKQTHPVGSEHTLITCIPIVTGT